MSATKGIYTYRINGTIHHKLSKNLLNKDNIPTDAGFSQICIYHPELQTDIISSKYSSLIKKEILNMIQEQLNIYNEYVKVYQQAGKK